MDKDNVSGAPEPGDLLGLAGKRALVIGGGQGMGESTALRLAQAGCGVAVVDIDEGRANAVASRVAGFGVPSAAVLGNALDNAQVAGIVDRAEKQLGGLDILVTIIGQALFAPAVDVTPDQWEMEIQRNLGYVFFTSQAFARSLIKRGTPGAITCIASVSGLQSAPMHAPYGAAKQGLVNLVRSLAVEWAKHGIRVNAVAPGSILTPRMKANSNGNFTDSMGAIPFKRFGTTDEIGKATLFLCSEMASYVTGTTLPVDGGWMAANLWIRPD
jgi:NAD(P)-dependent dehydrogenase (short-subunit alcohol dehydrogenase family)